MPRDAGGRVFALDQQTGRLVWDNAQMLGIDLVGEFDRTIIVRGRTTIAALDAETGEPKWYLPISDSIIGRAQLIGSSVYLGDTTHLSRLDARTGRVLQTRKWDLGDERPQAFLVHANRLFVISDKPAIDQQDRIRVPLNSKAPQPTPLALPLKRVWTLHRSSPTVALPPAGSPLQGKAYILSGGILECVDISPQGSILWRRFVNSRQLSIQFFHDSLLMIRQEAGPSSKRSNRLIALNANTGRVQWEQTAPDSLRNIVHCDSILALHDARGSIIGIDRKSGRRVWGRFFGLGQTMNVSWDGTDLQVMRVSSERVSWHHALDQTTGNTSSESRIETGIPHGNAANGALLKSGYYQVTFTPKRGRYIRLVALSEINGQGWTSIAELHAVGNDGHNLPRDDWKVLKVDSYEKLSRYDTRPETVFDNDPVSWWHTPWIGGIKRHPHEIQIDLGSEQSIKGIRYLPAVIINNNGMIKDYELYVSDDASHWGKPVAKGVMVNRLNVERPMFANKSFYFEARNHQNNTHNIYQYSLDGKPAKVVRENARLVMSQDGYVIMTVSQDNKQVLTVTRVDDPSYRFDVTADLPIHREGELRLDHDRLVVGRRSLVVADLKRRKFIIPPSKNNLPQNRSGMLMKIGRNGLLKIVNMGGNGQAMFFLDLESGQQTESKLANRSQPFHDNSRSHMLHFEDVVLLSDGASVSAWIKDEEAVSTN